MRDFLHYHFHFRTFPGYGLPKTWKSLDELILLILKGILFVVFTTIILFKKSTLKKFDFFV